VTPDIAGAVVSFIFGLAIGSFLNVCIHRLPRDESIVWPPSHCPHCNARLRPWDNLPLLSQLLLRSRCRACGAHYSWRYFIVELLAGLVFGGLWLIYGPTVEFALMVLFAAVLIVVFFVDLEHMIIPDQLPLVAAAAGLLKNGYDLVARHSVALVGDPSVAKLPGLRPWVHLPIPWTGYSLPIPAAVAGLVLGAAVFILIDLFSQLLFRKEGMGGGDMKLGAAIGAVLGPTLALLSFGLAVVAGAVIGMALILVRLRKRAEYVPFGPFLAVTALAVALAPGAILSGVHGAWLWWIGTWAPQ
jgi:leader peptidase (prepilin peptidase)/N-methyltransferase